VRLSPEETRLLAKSGVVSVDQRVPYTMGSAYEQIFQRDLPLLVTTDSVLHALHKSFDRMLQELETGVFSDAISAVLDDAHARLATAAAQPAGADAGLADSLRDVDLYLTVARNLMAGAAGQPDESNAKPAFVFVPSKLGQDQEAHALLEQLARFVPASSPSACGPPREIDFSQFRPRGHYALTTELRRYFRAMMWLGRADTGFVVGPRAAADATSDRCAARALRSAAALALSLEEAVDQPNRRLHAMNDIVDFLVGASDNGTLLELRQTMHRAGVESLTALAAPAQLASLATAVGAEFAGRGQILSQLSVNAAPPKVFQLFAQRFALDSYVLAKVITPLRTMPSGLDVMAALGNDEAVRLLEPDLERGQYVAELAAARQLVTEQRPQEWNAALYASWLDALRTLDDRPPGPGFPRAMQTVAWRRKQLQTQLGSWSELRHDTILYVAQSYSQALCSYPDAYVEPYPAFFARLGQLAGMTAQRLTDAQLPITNPKRTPFLEGTQGRMAAFFRGFEARMGDLERLARKELAGQPFTKQESTFLKGAVRMHPGCGSPWYDGWYSQLFYTRSPTERSPTVGDVHTDPNVGAVLEAAVGDAKLLVVAIDNRGDRAVYVGPAYSYYEFVSPMNKRLTDAEWQARLDGGELPPRPAWTAPFQGAPLARTLGAPPPRATKK
jgi:hypothetical protein